MLTLLEVLDKTTHFFQQKGLDQPRLQAELLLAHALGCKRLDLFLKFDQPMQEQTLELLRGWVRRRAGREPLQYIVGDVPFHDLKLKTDKRALIPRPETEQLVEEIIKRATTPPAKILDLGTGTGALALALAAACKDSQVTAVDASEEALSLARENANSTGLTDRVEFIRSNWFENVSGQFDIIVSNPPYLTPEEWESAEPEVKDHEPYGALVSGPEGLDDISVIVAAAPRYLSADGLLALETGIAQHEEIERMAKEAGFERTDSVRDLTDRPRFFFCYV